MTKLYRIVPVKDSEGVKGRLPDKKYNYPVLFKEINGGIFEKYCYHPEQIRAIKQTCEYWLEEVEMPSENDKKDMMASIHLDNYQRRIFSAGAKWMRDLIFKNK